MRPTRKKPAEFRTVDMFTGHTLEEQMEAAAIDDIAEEPRPGRILSEVSSQRSSYQAVKEWKIKSASNGEYELVMRYGAYETSIPATVDELRDVAFMIEKAVGR